MEVKEQPAGILSLHHVDPGDQTQYLLASTFLTEPSFQPEFRVLSISFGTLTYISCGDWGDGSVGKST